MSRVLELYGTPTSTDGHNWSTDVREQQCPYLGSRCVKIRKSQPDVSIGTCSVAHGRNFQSIVICPHRFIQNSTVFIDCIHLLTRHRPGNAFHLLSEVSIPGGSVDYFLVSANNRKVSYFVAIELQALDTTRTVWPERQRFLQNVGVATDDSEYTSRKSFGINWKMSAKTILVQLHHKIETFQALNKNLVLVAQDVFLDYMRREFAFDHVGSANPDDTLHFYAYEFQTSSDANRLQLTNRLSTDPDGVAKCLGLQASANINLTDMISRIEQRLSDNTLLNIVGR